MDNTQLHRLKANLICELRSYLPKVREQLTSIDSRLWLYVTERTEPLEHWVLTLDDEGTEINDCLAGLHELLGMRKCLRLLATYRFNVQKARQWLLAQEGVWHQTDNGRWEHVRGGLKFDTPRGAQHVRLMNFQTWCTCMAMGFETDVCMEREDDGTPLLPSEYVGEDGMVWDVRRLCNEIHFFITRKAGKTEYGVSLSFAEMMIMGDMNAQVSIVANSKDQAVGIAYDKAKQYAWQVDPSSTNKLGGKLLKVGATGMEFVAGCKRTASLAAFAAGGKPRDGWNSEWILADEHGQAAYVNDRSDMENTVQVFVGSGGVRRERMILHTTTAGLVTTGPYKDLLEKVQLLLLDEMQVPLGSPKRTTEDKWFAFLCQLDCDNYDGTLDSLNHQHLWRRVNPAFGITVQPTWYRERLHDAATKNEDVRKEVLTKDFNIWQGSNVTEWIDPELVRRLQIDARIDDCIADEDWRVFVGMDFSMGNDLHAVSYLAFRETEQGFEFFADMDAWISAETLATSSVQKLYERWIADGWLHVSPGATLEPTLPVERMMELYDKGVTFLGFGYDPYKAKTPINSLSAWVAELVGADAVKQYIMPVRQNYASYNPVVEELDFMIKNNPPLLHFSRNPMWAWEAGNMVLDVSTDGMENKKMVKRNPGIDSCKVDNWQALASALMMYDNAEGKVQ